jgi:hypothetical protein
VNPSDNPVPVTGVVEVVNPSEPLWVEIVEPAEIYSQSKGTVIGTSRDALLNFDVPEGKRLVIETVTALGQLPVGRKMTVAMTRRGGSDEGASTGSDHLSIESQGVIPERSAGLPKETYAATHSLRVRVDGTSRDDEVVIVVRTSSEPGDNNTNNFVGATIAGYLVDL